MRRCLTSIIGGFMWRVGSIVAFGAVGPRFEPRRGHALVTPETDENERKTKFKYRTLL